MADNYLERQYEALQARKAQKNNSGKKAQHKFYTRPVVTSTHEERQAAIAKALEEAARGKDATSEGLK